MNVLNDQKELLEINKRKLKNSFPGLEINAEQITNGQEVPLKLNELIYQESLNQLINLVKLQPTLDRQNHEFTNMIQNLNKYIRTVRSKIKVGHELLELIERNLNR